MSTPDDPPLGEYLDAWLERRRNQLRATTLDSYEVVIRNYLRPQLGPTRLSDLDRRIIEGAYAKLLASGGRNDQSLSPRTVESAHWVLRSALEDARLDGLLQDNPAEHATPPRRDMRATEIDDGPQVWSAKQAREFLLHVEDHPLRALWHLAVGTGARRSELLGLRWKDVDLAGGTVVIRRSLTVAKGVARLLRTKTSQGRRIAIAASVVDALQRHRGELDEELQLAGDAWHNEWDLVFTEETGRYLHPNSLSGEFKRLVGVHDLPDIRLHDLRHTHASVLLSLGVPVKVISERLGHASITTTMDIYTHLLPPMDQEAATTLQVILDLAQGGGDE